MFYLEKYIKKRVKYNISNIYMIGDNPDSDIKGANS